MIKVVINKCHGGIGLSTEAVKALRERGVSWALTDDGMRLAGEKYNDGTTVGEHGFNSYRPYNTDDKIWRTDPLLIEVVEALKSTANGAYSKLSIIEIPDDVNWKIEEYDGLEWIAEVHRTWG